MKGLASTSQLFRVWIVLAAAVLAAIVVALVPPLRANAAPTVPSGFQEKVVLDGLNNPTNVEFSEDGRVATDSGGLTDTESVRLDPETVILRFRTNPAGLRLVVGSDRATTPFSRTAIVGSNNSISAPSPQSLAGTTYDFVSFSDGGAQTHNIVAPADTSTYTANYD